MTKATLDNAEMTRDLLTLAKGEEISEGNEKPFVVQTKRVRLSDYKKRRLYGFGDTVILDDIYETEPKEFGSLEEAKRYIDEQIEEDGRGN